MFLEGNKEETKLSLLSNVEEEALLCYESALLHLAQVMLNLHRGTMKSEDYHERNKKPSVRELFSWSQIMTPPTTRHLKTPRKSI